MLPSFKPRLQNFRKIKYMQNIGNKEVASDLMESSFSYNMVILMYLHMFTGLDLAFLWMILYQKKNNYYKIWTSLLNSNLP